MKRILFVATCDVRTRTGGGLANLAYYNAFKEMFPGMVDLALAEEHCTGIYKDAIKISRRGRIEKVLALLRGETHRNKAFFRSYLREVSTRYSYCVINGGVYAGDMIDLFHAYGIRVLVIHHNFEREYQQGNKSWKTLWGLNACWVNKIERNAYLKSDLNCYLTSADRDLFHKYYGNCKGKEYLLGVFEPSDSLRVERSFLTDATGASVRHIIVSGSMDSVQTIAGVMDFKERYYHIFAQKFIGWNVIFAGRNPSPEIIRFCEEHPERLELVPNPPVMEEVISRGILFLCPTCVGGGLKLRLMDALRQGMPVLTHAVSARGYDAFFGCPFSKSIPMRRALPEAYNY